MAFLKYALPSALLCACTLAQPGPATGSVEGKVLNSVTGAAVRKAIVRLQGDRSQLTAESDTEGRFQFLGLPAGTYALRAERAGFFNRAARRVSALGSGEHVSGAEIRLPPHGVITGRILDEDGDPIPNARVISYKFVYRNGGKGWHREGTSMPSNDSGEYRVFSLTPGRYIIQAISDRPVTNNRYQDPNSPVLSKLVNVPVYYPNALSQETASPIEVSTGAQVGGIDIRMTKGQAYPVAGRLTGVPAAFNKPLGISLGKAGEDGAGGGFTDARPPDYRFSLALPVGQYNLVLVGANDEFFAKALVNVSGEIRDLVVPVVSPPQVSGRFTATEENGCTQVQGVGVYLLSQSGMMTGWEYADASGTFSFSKPPAPGRYSLEVDSTKLPANCFVQAVRLGGKEVRPADIPVEDVTRLEIVLSTTAGLITGSVSDADGKALPIALVTVIPVDAGAPNQTIADENGAFRFARVRPGSYTLYAWEEVDKDQWPDPEFLKQFSSHAVKVNVGPGETQTAQLKVIALEEMK